MSQAARNPNKRAYYDDGLDGKVTAQRQRAIEAKDELAQLSERIFGQFGAEVGEVKIKPRRSLGAKAVKDYGGVVGKVTDVVRNKTVCDTADQIDRCRQAAYRQRELQIARYGRGIEEREHPPEPIIISIKDNIAEPKTHGYRAFYVKARMPNGAVSEMQLVHRAMEAKAEKTHGAL